MPHQLPCPNPTCVHQFGATEVQSVTTLTCPRCGQVFQFRPQENGSAKSAMKPMPAPVGTQAAPVSQGQPSLPVAVPIKSVASAVLAAAPASTPSASVAVFDGPAQPSPTAGAFDVRSSEGEPLLRSIVRRPRRRWTRVLVPFNAIIVAVGIVGGGIWAISTYFLPQQVKPPTKDVWNVQVEVRNQKNAMEKACRVILPKKSWSTDTELRQGLAVATAFRFKDPDDSARTYWCAIHAKDYGYYRPRDAELLRVGIDCLDKHFGETLETEAKIEPAKLGKVDVQRLTFKGRVTSVIWWGDMYVFTQHGIGYWLFIAAPTRDEAREGFKEFQGDTKGLVLETARGGWREQDPPRDTFLGTEKMVTASAPEGLFAKHADPTVEDEHGLLLLYGRKEKDNRKIAHVLVLSLDKAGDLKQSFKAARDYIEADKKKDGQDYKLALALEERDGQGESGIAEDFAGQRGRIGEYKLLLGEETKRYILIAAINQGGKTFVVRCECAWESRSIWRQDFLDFLGVLRFGSTKGE